MDLKTIQKYLIYQFSSEAELVNAIQEISQKFTTQREDIRDYINDKKLVAAYTCFYLATNLPKLAATLEKVEIDLGDFSACEFIDIGCGPGTFSLALLEQNDALKISAIEISDQMREQASILLDGIFPHAKVSFYSSAKKLPKKETKRFGIFGHSANEMQLTQIKEIIETLSLDYILFIEPGTKEFFHKSLEIRDVLKDKYITHYPCRGGNLACPLKDSNDWCHQYLHVAHAPSVERLTQLAKKDRRALPIIINFYTQEKLNSIQNSARVIRSFPPTKFSLEWQLCEFSNNSHQIVNLQVLSRHLKKARFKELAKIVAGDKITYTPDKSFDGKVRGKVSD